jgi:hypothetical protein
MNGVEEAGVDFRRFLSLIADLDSHDVADLRRRVMAAAAVGHLPAAMNGGVRAIEVRSTPPRCLPKHASCLTTTISLSLSLSRSLALSLKYST